MNVDTKQNKNPKGLLVSVFRNFGLLETLGSIFSVSGSYFTFESGNLQSDSAALSNDWNTIGQDMQIAWEKFDTTATDHTTKITKMSDDLALTNNEDDKGPEHNKAENGDSGSKELEQDHTLPALPEEIDVFLETVPEPQRQAVKAVLAGVFVSQRIWQGPHLPPDILKQYNDAFPNGAERIFLEGQKQTDHRIAMEQQVVGSKLKLNGNGQIFGFILALAFLLVAGFLTYMGHEVAGVILGTVDLLGLVAVFVLGKQPSKSQKGSGSKPEKDD